MDLLQQISDSLQNGDEKQVFELTRQAIEQKVPAKQILDDGLIAGMNIVGEQFRTHKIFIPHVLFAAKAMYAGMDQLKPLLIKENIRPIGKIVLGTIEGDLHDIGKNLVGIMLKGAGFEVIDLGKDVSADTFVQTAIAESADIIGMSALLTTTMLNMRKVTDLLRARDLNSSIRTIVGGAPLSEAFAREIGADAYAYDAANAVDRVKKLLESA
ncbi:cobalamin-binding protein [candidate division KSB1 bacterium]|nr:corrinoid protein [candidate division KSB1 bacterium]RQW05225.1 MAG: cobalamin-binding protein [candidate division KSB1 bacterium]